MVVCTRHGGSAGRQAAGRRGSSADAKRETRCKAVFPPHGAGLLPSCRGSRIEDREEGAGHGHNAMVRHIDIDMLTGATRGRKSGQGWGQDSRGTRDMRRLATPPRSAAADSSCGGCRPPARPSAQTGHSSWPLPLPCPRHLMLMSRHRRLEPGSDLTVLIPAVLTSAVAPRPPPGPLSAVRASTSMTALAFSLSRA